MEGTKDSSHFGHVAFVILAFLIGGVIGYMVGVAYENENQADNNWGMMNVFHAKTNPTASPSSTATVSPTVSPTASPAL